MDPDTSNNDTERPSHAEQIKTEEDQLNERSQEKKTRNSREKKRTPSEHERRPRSNSRSRERSRSRHNRSSSTSSDTSPHRSSTRSTYSSRQRYEPGYRSAYSRNGKMRTKWHDKRYRYVGSRRHQSFYYRGRRYQEGSNGAQTEERKHRRCGDHGASPKKEISGTSRTSDLNNGPRTSKSYEYFASRNNLDRKGVLHGKHKGGRTYSPVDQSSSQHPRNKYRDSYVRNSRDRLEPGQAKPRGKNGNGKCSGYDSKRLSPIFNRYDQMLRSSSGNRPFSYLRHISLRNTGENYRNLYNSKPSCTVTSGALMDINLEGIFSGTFANNENHAERNEISNGSERDSAAFSMLRSIRGSEAVSKTCVGGEQPTTENFMNSKANENNVGECEKICDWQKSFQSEREWSNGPNDNDWEMDTQAGSDWETDSECKLKKEQEPGTNRIVKLDKWSVPLERCTPPPTPWNGGFSSVGISSTTIEYPDTTQKESTPTTPKAVVNEFTGKSNFQSSPSAGEMLVTSSTTTAVIELETLETCVQLHDPRLSHPSYIKKILNVQSSRHVASPDRQQKRSFVKKSTEILSTVIEPDRPGEISENMDYSNIAQVGKRTSENESNLAAGTQETKSSFCLLQSQTATPKPNSITSKLDLWDRIHKNCQSRRTLEQWQAITPQSSKNKWLYKRPPAISEQAIRHKYPSLVECHGIDWVVDILNIDDLYLEYKESQILELIEHEDLSGARDALLYAKQHRLRLRTMCQEFAKTLDAPIPEYEEFLKRCISGLPLPE